MTVFVKADPTAGQREGDWKVTTDGGRKISGHRTKRRAIKKAKQKARAKDTDVKIQDATTGHWNQGPSY